MLNKIMKILYLMVLIIAGYQTYSHYIGNIEYCNINGLFNCSTVLFSKYSTIFGVPISVFAMIWASFGLGTMVIHSYSNKYKILLLLNGIGLICSFLLLIVMIFFLKKLCLYCLIIDGLIGILYILTRYQPKIKFNVDFLLWAFLISFIVFGLSFGTTFYFIKESRIKIKQFSHNNSKVMKSPLLRKSILILGNPYGKKIITEFTDFQCPACKQSFLIMDQLIKKDSNIKIILKNFPLSNKCNKYVKQDLHSWSCIGSYLAVCAQKQNMFKEYYDIIIKNQEKIKQPMEILPYLEAQKFNMIELLKCADNPETKKYVDLDIEEGNQLNIEGTPAIFYKNEKIELWSSEFVFEQLLKN